ncbi:MAG: ABC transporter ATP-binding protein [Deltaproteobacteria bacterium]|nr:ABC transporter ATP-binding protein [Deltaproteobacteria bacterium]
MAILELQGVSRHFGGLQAVSRVSFGVEEGRITSLIGPNGAGKTTIFNLVSGLLPLTGGSIRYHGAPLDGLSPQARARAGIGRAFQEPRVFHRMSVLDNVRIGFPGQSGERLLRGFLKWRAVREEERLTRAEAEKLLAMVGLAERAGHPAGDLSFGQQRFLSLARTLAMRPALLLLDEPTVGLTREEILELAALLRGLTSTRGQTILLIEHNMDIVMELSDWIILLVEGRVAEAGPPEEMKNHPKLLEAYFGVGHVA